MSDVICKFGFVRVSDQIEIEGEPVHVGCQNRVFSEDYHVFVWTRVSVGGFNRKRIIKIEATGYEYTGKYIGTVVMPTGLVWHVIEV